VRVFVLASEIMANRCGKGREVLLQLVRRPARGDEVEFVEVEAPVGSAGDGKMAVVDGIEEPPKIAYGEDGALQQCGALAVVNETPRRG